jgi:hypothetical protein
MRRHVDAVPTFVFAFHRHPAVQPALGALGALVTET